MNLIDVIRTAYNWRDLWVEHGIDYAKYIRSPKWKRKAAAAKERAGHRCQICNSPDNLNAHHRTYVRLGHERPDDITVLCRQCHKLFSQNSRLSK